MKQSSTFRLLNMKTSPRATEENFLSGRRYTQQSERASDGVHSGNHSKPIKPKAKVHFAKDAAGEAKLAVVDAMNELEQVQRQNCPITSSHLKKIFLLLRQLVSPASQYASLMEFTLDCLEQYIFVSDHDLKQYKNEVYEIQLANMLSKEITYRKLAILLLTKKKELDHSRDSDHAQNQYLLPEPDSPTKKSMFYRRPISPMVVEINLPQKFHGNSTDKESSISSKPASPVLAPREKLNKIAAHLNHITKPRTDWSRQNLFLTTSDDKGTNLQATRSAEGWKSANRIASIEFKDNISSFPAIPLSSVRVDVDSKDLNQKVQSLYQLNSKLAYEINNLMDENTTLKLNYAESQAALVTLESLKGENTIKLSNELDKSKKVVSDLQSELTKTQEKCKALETIVSDVRQKIETVAKLNLDTIKRVEAIVGDRDGQAVYKVIKEPDLYTLFAKRGFFGTEFGFKDQDTFEEKLQKIIAKIPMKKKSTRMNTRFEQPTSESKLQLKNMITPSHSTVGQNFNAQIRVLRKASLNPLRSPIKQFTTKESFSQNQNLKPLSTLKTFRNNTKDLMPRVTVQQSTMRDGSHSNRSNSTHKNASASKIIMDLHEGEEEGEEEHLEDKSEDSNLNFAITYLKNIFPQELGDTIKLLNDLAD